MQCDPQSRFGTQIMQIFYQTYNYRGSLRDVNVFAANFIIFFKFMHCKNHAERKTWQTKRRGEDMCHICV